MEEYDACIKVLGRELISLRERIDKMQNKVVYSSDLDISLMDNTIIWVIDGVSNISNLHRKSEPMQKLHISNNFRTSSGYKFNLRLSMNSVDNYIGIFVKPVEQKLNDILEYPIDITVNFTLMDQVNGQHFRKVSPDSIENVDSVMYGLHRFISHEEVFREQPNERTLFADEAENPQDDKPIFVKKDRIFIMVEFDGIELKIV